jgi:hypothetical protein
MITDAVPVQVPLTRFYQRMIAEGSLVRVDAPTQPDGLTSESSVPAAKQSTEKRGSK